MNRLLFLILSIILLSFSFCKVVKSDYSNKEFKGMDAEKYLEQQVPISTLVVCPIMRKQL